MFQDGNNDVGLVALLAVAGGCRGWWRLLAVFKNENIDDLYILNII